MLRRHAFRRFDAAPVEARAIVIKELAGLVALSLALARGELTTKLVHDGLLLFEVLEPCVGVVVDTARTLHRAGPHRQTLLVARPWLFQCFHFHLLWSDLNLNLSCSKSKMLAIHVRGA